MNLVEVRLKYESKSDDRFRTNFAEIILPEWGISEEIIYRKFKNRLEWRFNNNEVDLSAKEFLDLVGTSQDEAQHYMQLRYPILKVIDSNPIAPFVKEFYEKGYDTILTSVTLSIQDQS
jgi:hypothetical protein